MVGVDSGAHRLVKVWETLFLTVWQKAEHVSVALQAFYQIVIPNLSQYKLFSRKQQPLALLLYLPSRLFLAASKTREALTSARFVHLWATVETCCYNMVTTMEGNLLQLIHRQ